MIQTTKDDGEPSSPSQHQLAEMPLPVEIFHLILEWAALEATPGELTKISHTAKVRQVPTIRITLNAAIRLEPILYCAILLRPSMLDKFISILKSKSRSSAFSVQHKRRSIFLSAELTLLLRISICSPRHFRTLRILGC